MLASQALIHGYRVSLVRFQQCFISRRPSFWMPQVKSPRFAVHRCSSPRFRLFSLPSYEDFPLCHLQCPPLVLIAILGATSIRCRNFVNFLCQLLPLRFGNLTSSFVLDACEDICFSSSSLQKRISQYPRKTLKRTHLSIFPLSSFCSGLFSLAPPSCPAFACGDLELPLRRPIVVERGDWARSLPPSRSRAFIRLHPSKSVGVTSCGASFAGPSAWGCVGSPHASGFLLFFNLCTEARTPCFQVSYSCSKGTWWELRSSVPQVFNG